MVYSLDSGTNVKSMYDLYSLVDRGAPGGGRAYEVPLGIGVYFSLNGNPLRGVDFCFLVDCSSSMGKPPGADWTEQTAWDAVMRSIEALETRLSADDRVAIVAFNHEITRIGRGLESRSLLKSFVNAIPRPSGQTDIAGAIRLGVEILSECKGRRARVLVLLTDGRAQVRRHEGQSDRDVLRESAIAAIDEMERVKSEGIDFVSMGFGLDWDVDLLNRLSRVVGQRRAEFIGSRQAASDCFSTVVEQQHSVVATNVTIEAILNTQHFEWKAVRSVLPNRTGAYAIRPEGTAELSNIPAISWRHSVGNVRCEQDTRYSLIIEAWPIADQLSAGVCPIGSFWLASAGKPVSSQWDLTLEVRSEPLLDPNACSPQNPNPPIELDWRLSLIPDIQERIHRYNRTGRHEEAVAQWHQLLDILRKGECPEVEIQAEQQQFELFCRDHQIDPMIEKQLNAARTSTVVSSSEFSARAALQDDHRARHERATSGRIISIPKKDTTFVQREIAKRRRNKRH